MEKGLLITFPCIHAQVQNLREGQLTCLEHITLDSIDLGSLMPMDVEDEQISKYHIIPLS